MEPRQNIPRQSFESAYGYRGESGQSAPGGRENNTERRVDRVPERLYTETENLPPVLPVAPAPLPMPTQQVQNQANQTSAQSDAPAVAADEDLIEKEWVDKAKKIIESTKADPYKRELEIGKLQRDYIRKRYGREIGETDAS